MKYKAILFDFYMTLVDIQTDERQPRVWETLACFLRYWGVRVDAGRLSELYFETVRRDLDSSDHEYPDICIRAIFRQMLSELNYEGTEQLEPHLAKLMRGLTVQHLYPFADTVPTLDALRPSFKLALVSDAQRDFIDPELEITGLESYWDKIVISSDYGFRKPDPRTIRRALNGLEVAADEAVYVGDNVFHDVRGAQNAKVFSILIDRHDQLGKNSHVAIPDKVFCNLSAMCEWLMEH